MEKQRFLVRILTYLLSLSLASVVIHHPKGQAAPAGQVDFQGEYVFLLPNGNILISDPYFDAGGIEGAGRVYMLDGTTLQEINQLAGTHSGDLVGNVTVLPSGNYLVASPFWDNGTIIDAGSVTFCSGTDGCPDQISPENSLVGSHIGDQLGGNLNITILSDGDYTIGNPFWDNGLVSDAGAVTFCSGIAGCTGIVSPMNSLVGSHAGDQVGLVQSLSDGDYFVYSSSWDNGPVTDAGAVTFCNGVNGCTGAVSPQNSLVGSESYKGGNSVTPLPNGNYVVLATHWDDGKGIDQGAATFCSGVTGCNGNITAENSLVGFQGDGEFFVRVLPSSNYVVGSSSWDNGAIVNAGSVTFCSGETGCKGPVTLDNSLIGSHSWDTVGFSGSSDSLESNIVILTSGNYVISSPNWHNGTTFGAGAVTLCDGQKGCVGEITPENSLVGIQQGSNVGLRGVLPLPSGGYVVSSPYWDWQSVVDVGAVTFCPFIGCTGVVTKTNSLIGSHPYDSVGYRELTSLKDGDYVVSSNLWDNGTEVNAGAVTFCKGDTGCVGEISSENSLVGEYAGQVGLWISSLADGDYVVGSREWDNGAEIDVGAATFCRRDMGCTGTVTPENSLIGSHTGDQIGFITALSNGDYVVHSASWDKGTIFDAGAATLCNGISGCVGLVSETNSFTGSQEGEEVGSKVIPLTGGNYVIGTEAWEGFTGAVSFCSADGSCAGQTPSEKNSLVGNQVLDQVGWEIKPLENGDYVVSSPYVDNGIILDGGAVTLCRVGSCVGPISSENSVLGGAENAMMYGLSMENLYDYVHNRLIVKRPAEKIITFFTFQLLTSSISLSASSNKLELGESLILTASVVSQNGPPTGVVTFFDGETVLNSASLDNNQTAAITTTLSLGPHDLTAHYAGDSNYAASTSTAVQVIVQANQVEQFLPIIRR